MTEANPPELFELARLESVLNDLLPEFRWSKEDGLKLERIEALVRRLGDPQTKYPTVHVGGTSGKGTVAAMVAATLTSSALRVGLHLSPYVQSITETWQIDGKYMLPSRVLPTAEQVIHQGAPIEDDLPFGRPSYFETKVAIAFQLFRESGVDVGVIEVGLGGALDATNVIGPGIKVLTSVSLDHTEILGDTVEKIADDKVQIIHPGSVVISGVEQATVKEIVRRRCERVGATLFALDEDIQYRSDEDRLTIDGPVQISFEVPKNWPNYQRRNAVIAASAAHVLGLRDIEESLVTKALTSVHLPGRFERFQEMGHDIVLDGAHNPEKMRTTADQLRSSFPLSRFVAVLALKETKDAPAVLAEIVPLCDSIILTTFRAGLFLPMDPQLLAEHLQQMGFSGDVSFQLDPNSAVSEALSQSKEGEVIVVTGSLYLAGNVRSRWISPIDDIIHGSSYST